MGWGAGVAGKCSSGINISLIGRVGSNHMRINGGEDFKFSVRQQDRVNHKSLGRYQGSLSLVTQDYPLMGSNTQDILSHAVRTDKPSTDGSHRLVVQQSKGKNHNLGCHLLYECHLENMEQLCHYSV